MPSRIEAGLTFEGSLRGEGELVVAGRVRGVLTLQGTLVVEEGGAVEAEVECDRAVVAGLLSGSIQAHDELRIAAGGHVDARVRANRLAVADGAVFRGELQAPQVATPRVQSLPARPEVLRMAAAPAAPALDDGYLPKPAIGAPPVKPASKPAPKSMGFAAPARVSPPPAEALADLPTRRPPPMAAPAPVRPVGPPKMPGLPRGRTALARRDV